MRTFMIDIWDDLREKRLWPVALLLAVAAVAVPVVLLSGGSDEKPAPAAKAASKPAKVPIVTEEVAGGQSSALGIFDPKDPFKAPASLKPKAPAATATAGSTGAGSTSPGGGATASGGSSSSGATPPSTTQTQPSVVRQRRKLYTYVVDVRYGRHGHEAKHTMKRLQMLPDGDAPQLVFLGVTSDAKRAVFLVNPGVEAAGEASCKPSRKDCTYLFLTTHYKSNQKRFTNEDGMKTNITLLAIRQVEVKPSKSSKASASNRRSRRTAFLDGQSR
jgi:hypothetical protein